TPGAKPKRAGKAPAPRGNGASAAAESAESAGKAPDASGATGTTPNGQPAKGKAKSGAAEGKQNRPSRGGGGRAPRPGAKPKKRKR
ncbi:unnamed protein product, partial [marine sediment metagenome]